MKNTVFACLLLIASADCLGQPLPVAQIKTNIEHAANPVAYVRETLKKKYKIDTVTITNSTHFSGLADSLAYSATLKKVYGPYEGKVLVEVLARLPNTFTRVSQIFIDTSVFSRRIADSVANSILLRLRNNSASFEDLAQTYSMGGEGATRGDLGWIAKGTIIPLIDRELAKRKKGEIFKVWTRRGVHIVKKTSDSRQDTGFALLMRIFL